MSMGAQRLMVRGTTFLGLVALALVAAPAQSAAQQQQGVQGGDRVYVQYCQGCHSDTGEGNPGVYPPLAGSEWVTGAPARLLSILLHGLTGPVSVAGEVYTGLMPGWAALRDEELAAVATYIRSSWGNFAPGVTVADVQAVREATKGRTAMWTVPDLIAATTAEK